MPRVGMRKRKALDGVRKASGDCERACSYEVRGGVNARREREYKRALSHCIPQRGLASAGNSNSQAVREYYRGWSVPMGGTKRQASRKQLPKSTLCVSLLCIANFDYYLGNHQNAQIRQWNVHFTQCGTVSTRTRHGS
eukprot:1023304-Rhodomonas_salina.1